MTRILVAHYSTYGTNFDIAKHATRHLEDAGFEVRHRKFAETAPQSVIDTQPAWVESQNRQSSIPDISGDDIVWAQGLLISVPTRFGSAPSQMRAFIDTLGGLWAQGQLAGKAVSVMTSAQNPHAGQESTILGLYGSFMHWGSIIVPPGFDDASIMAAGGNPYGFSKTAGSALTEDEIAAIGFQARKLAKIASSLD